MTQSYQAECNLPGLDDLKRLDYCSYAYRLSQRGSPYARRNNLDRPGRPAHHTRAMQALGGNQEKAERRRCGTIIVSSIEIVPAHPRDSN